MRNDAENDRAIGDSPRAGLVDDEADGHACLSDPSLIERLCKAGSWLGDLLAALAAQAEPEGEVEIRVHKGVMQVPSPHPLILRLVIRRHLCEPPRRRRKQSHDLAAALTQRL